MLTVLASDLSQRHALYQKSVPRGLLFAGVFSVMPFLFLLILPVWWHWRRTMNAMKNKNAQQLQ